MIDENLYVDVEASKATKIEQVALNLAQIKEALEHNAQFFIEFFLNDEIRECVPDFHVDIFSAMVVERIKRYCCAVPRDHAKTTLAKLAAIWHFLFSEYSFVVYISNTATIAVEATKDIIAFMETENFINVFGEVEFVTKQEGNGYFVFKLGDKLCILRAYGAAQQIRGTNIRSRRPQLAIVDDLEDIDNIATKEMAEKLSDWFYGSFRKALDKFDNKIIHIGNMINNYCMLKTHIESDYWHSMKYGCLLANGEPLWPEAWTVDKLKVDYREYQKVGKAHIWFAEMMNMPLASGRGLIRPEKITYVPEKELRDCDYGFITIDPAISTREWADECAIVGHGFTGTEWLICEFHKERGISFETIFDIAIEMAFRGRVNYIGIETGALQGVLLPVFEFLLRLRNIQNIIFVPMQAKVQKTQRLVAWTLLLIKKEYALPLGDVEITEQLLTYNPKGKGNTDDLIDACAYGPQMIKEHEAEIVESRLSAVPPEQMGSGVLSSYDICAF